MRILYGVLFFLLICSCYAQTREIAITIDDLPLVASKMNTPGNQQRATERFTRIIEMLKENRVPATGFVIAGAIQNGQWDFLEQFRAAGFDIGNHTYSHSSLNRIGAEKYIADVARADKILAPLLTQPKYFRYPYLAEGNKRSKPEVLSFLAENGYTVAPVTIDSKDFQFNEQLYRIPYRSRESHLGKIRARYLDYIWKQTLRAERLSKDQNVKQILLIHANLLNSYVLGDIIQMYKKNGYTFVTLTEALKQPAPAINLPEIDAEGVNDGLRAPKSN